MASKYDGLARIIMQNVGGTENVKALTHCVTRLRFQLKDEKKANTDVLKETEGIVTVIQNSEHCSLHADCLDSDLRIQAVSRSRCI